jgi:hypothetical protein
MLKAEGSRAYLCVGRVSNPPFFRPTIIYFPIADFWASRVVAPRRTIPPLTREARSAIRVQIIIFRA